MLKRVYIVHRAAIIQAGLTEILRRGFQCSVESYASLQELAGAGHSISHSDLIFVDHKISNSPEYLEFLQQTRVSDSILILPAGKKPSKELQLDALYLDHTTSEMLEQLKRIFQANPTPAKKEASAELSGREIDVLKLVALGNANKEIAEKLFISTHTVISHRKNITEKLGIKSISGLTVYAIINGLIDTSALGAGELI